MNYKGYDTQGSVENRLSYMFNRLLRIPQIINMLGLEYTRVANMQGCIGFSVSCILKIQAMLNVFSYAKFLNLSGVKYAIVTKGSK